MEKTIERIKPGGRRKQYPPEMITGQGSDIFTPLKKGQRITLTLEVVDEYESLSQIASLDLSDMKTGNGVSGVFKVENYNII